MAAAAASARRARDSSSVEPASDVPARRGIEHGVRLAAEAETSLAHLGCTCVEPVVPVFPPASARELRLLEPLFAVTAAARPVKEGNHPLTRRPDDRLDMTAVDEHEARLRAQ